MRYEQENNVMCARSLMVLSVALCMGTGHDLAAQGNTVRPVTVVTPKVGPLTRKSLIQAEVLPLESMRLVPRVTGYLKQIFVKEGDLVEGDKVLVEIDCPDREADLRICAAELKEAVAEVSVAKSSLAAARQGEVVARSRLAIAKTMERLATLALNFARIEHTRVRNLLQKGASTQAELDEAELALNRTEADISAAKAKTEAAKADVAEARSLTDVKAAAFEKAKARADTRREQGELADVFYGFRKIRNPYPQARITRQLLDPGNLVHANQSELLEVMNVTRVRIRMGVPEVEARKVQAGTEVRIIQPRTGTKDVAARVTRVAGAVDRDSLTMMAEIELDNSDGSWLPGSLCQVEVTVLNLENAITVDSRALTKSGARAYVWVVDDGIAHRREIRLGVDLGKTVQVLEGLTATDKVIVAGQSRLRDGETVRAIEG
ncbi:MAG: efflux RND transporter periplasmic adaptor subunit [Planctomycetota bacterium]